MSKLLALLCLTGFVFLPSSASITDAKSANDWEFISVPGTKCMSGQETGFWMKQSPHESSKLGIFLNGGGACFNAFTCATTASNPKGGRPGSQGIFSSDDSNPLANFSWIAVPYCTGDVHLGDITHHFEGAERNFQGHTNLNLMMQQVTKAFLPANVDTLYVTGESAGGFGAISNYDLFRSFYPGEGVRAALLDDSGPILDDDTISLCLQELWRSTWNINASLPKGCACIGDKGNIADIWQFSKAKWPKDSFGLVSSLDDGVISTFFGFGDLDCKSPIPLPYNKLAAGLRRLSSAGVPVYMIPGSGHEHTSSSEFFSRIVGDTPLYKWIAQLVAGGPDPASVDPGGVLHSDQVVV